MILEDTIVWMKYARYLPEFKRRENWNEIVERNLQFHLDRFPKITDEIVSAYDFVREKKILPSMRSLQFAGKPIEIANNRIYNCCYLPIDDYHAFSEAMFLLLGGCGVGFSVQKEHVNKLPKVSINGEVFKYVIQDSALGWADALKALVKHYFAGKAFPLFSFIDIREEGKPLKTSGGIAPGPEPLKKCLENINKIFRNALGRKLEPIEVHDIVCHIADGVLTAGTRRAALISFFDRYDARMLSAKSGEWWRDNPQRARANNSAVMLRGKDEEHFDRVFNTCIESGSGEPGIYWTNDYNFLSNPCVEASLRALTFCNLTTINAQTIKDDKDFYDRCSAASLIGTLQASYTDFHYLRREWKRRTEEDALLGVSITGIVNYLFNEKNLFVGANLVKETNALTASKIGINNAARTTLVKPEGTTSLVLGTSSGIHPWFDDYYLRRIRVNKNEQIYKYLKETNPEIIEDGEREGIISVPMSSSGINRNEEDEIDFLNRVSLFKNYWINPGHRRGENTHNVSSTVNYKDHNKVKEWMIVNKDNYNGLSLLPYDGGTYKQAPFEKITLEEYEERKENLKELDTNNIIEFKDNTTSRETIACGPTSCEIL